MLEYLPGPEFETVNPSSSLFDLNVHWLNWMFVASNL